MKLNTRELSLVALFSALIAVGAFIKIPFLIVPITLQTLFVVSAALILGKRLGPLSVIVYIVMGLIGLPVFAKGGGPMYVLQPTFGYLLGFIFTAMFIGNFKDKMNKYLLVTIGILITYAFGISYFVAIQHFVNGVSFEVGFLLKNLFLVFLRGDITSYIVAVIVSERISKVYDLKISLL